MTPRIVIALLLLSLSSGILAQGQQVQGYLYATDTGEPLVGASVQWIKIANVGTIADEHGFFELAYAEGIDSLRIAYLGYNDWRGILPKDSTAVIGLTPNVHIAAQVVVKTERRPAQIFATEQLNRLDIYLNAAAKADVLLAVNSLPAATNPDETANVSLRGSPSGATGIFFNHVPLKDIVRLDQPNGVGQFSIFNTAIVEGVDVYPSNPPVHLGQATSGAIDVRTTSSLKSEAKALSLHLAGGGLQWAEQWGKKTGLLAYLNHGNQRWLKAVNPEALSDLNRFASHDLGLFLTRELSERAKLVVFNLSIFERYNFSLREGRFDGLFQQRKDRNQTVVNYLYQANSWRLEWNHGFNRSKANYTLGNIITRLNLLDYHTNLLLHWQKGAWSGTTAAHYTYNRYAASGTYALFEGAWQANDPAAVYQKNGKTSLPELAFFAKRSLGNKHQLGWGIRSAWQAKESQLYYGAQLNWHYQLRDNQSLTLAGGRYYQSLEQRTEASTNSENRSYQLALDWQWTPPRWELKLAIYRHWLRWQGQNNPIFGQEASVRYLNYPFVSSLSASRVVSRIEDEAGSYPSRHDFGYLLRWQMQYQLPGNITWNVALSWREGSPYQPLIGREWNKELSGFLPIFSPLINQQRLPAYFRLDTGLSRPFSLGEGLLIAYANINNVLNQPNIRGYTYDADYDISEEALFSQLTFFAGAIYQWE